MEKPYDNIVGIGLLDNWLKGKFRESSADREVWKGGKGGVGGALLARELAVETAEGDAERLHGAQRVVVVHSEDVVSNATELHHDVVDCNKTKHNIDATNHAKKH